MLCYCIFTLGCSNCFIVFKTGRGWSCRLWMWIARYLSNSFVECPSNTQNSCHARPFSQFVRWHCLLISSLFIYFFLSFLCPVYSVLANFLTYFNWNIQLQLASIVIFQMMIVCCNLLDDISCLMSCCL